MCIDSRQSIQLCPYHMGIETDEARKEQDGLDEGMLAYIRHNLSYQFRVCKQHVGNTVKTKSIRHDSIQLQIFDLTHRSYNKQFTFSLSYYAYCFIISVQERKRTHNS